MRRVILAIMVFAMLTMLMAACGGGGGGGGGGTGSSNWNDLVWDQDNWA